MVEEFHEISQSEFEKFKVKYLSKLELFNNDVTFLLHVGSDNFMELQYYVLLLDSLQKIRPESIYKTVIESNARNNNNMKKQWGQDWGRINTYLSCFSGTFFKERDIFSSTTFGKLQLTSSDEVNFGRIIPLIPIDLKIFEFISKRVCEVFITSIADENGEKFFNCTQSKTAKKTSTIDIRGKKHITTKKNFEVSIHGLNPFEDGAQNLLYSACMKYLFGFDKRSTTDDYCDLFKQRISYYSSPKFFDEIKNISVLSFLIFCAFNRFKLLDILDQIQGSDTPVPGTFSTKVHIF